MTNVREVGSPRNPFPIAPTARVGRFLDLARVYGCINDQWKRRWGGEMPGDCFRGVDKETYCLNPSLLRYPHFQGMLRMGLRENNLWQEFRRRTIPFLGRSITPSWECMCVMQQHGLPTRLLDWSRSLAVGAYFAVRDIHDHQDGAVWIMAAKHLLELRGLNGCWRLSSDYPLLAALAMRDNDEGLDKFNAETPVVLDPDRLAPRLVAQKGLYSVHSFRSFSLEELATADRKEHGDACFLHKIVVPGQAKNDLRSDLFALTGTSEETLFPDMDGFARDYNSESWLRATGQLGPDEVHCPAVAALQEPPAPKKATSSG